jgi:hypothetical protein
MQHTTAVSKTHQKKEEQNMVKTGQPYQEHFDHHQVHPSATAAGT